jgi:AcrR family transcriptional regulator
MQRTSFSRGTASVPTPDPASPTAPPAERAPFVEAARALAEETGSASFTVQQVVARSGRSLKAFYRCFDGKDDLLVALLAEDCALAARLLARSLRRRRDPLAPLAPVEGWVRGVFRLMAVGDAGYVGVLVREYRRLAEERPEALVEALEPLVALLVEAIGSAAAAGALDPDRDARRDATTVLEVVLAKIHELLRPGHPDSGDQAAYTWSFVAGALGAADPATHARGTRRGRHG